ncbi:MAG: hypothetical protein AMK70_01400 [Nitrospira bacterium SG8_35_1]|nr:MAG: hypothetical protein AMK70_01400 [Nitrospira bacterium SG8_35_1]
MKKTIDFKCIKKQLHKKGTSLKKVVCLIILSILLLAVNSDAKDYVIGDGDHLRISVWGSPELTIEPIVRPDGKISVLALGEIKASGFTALELTNILEKEMEKIIKSPIITVIVTKMTNYRVFVIGKGASPGVHILARETTLLEFLAQMGSLDNADLENAYLVRNKMKIKTGFLELFEKGNFSQDIVLEANDMLYIPDNFEKRISITGAVDNPSTLPYRKGITLLDVILSVGGFSEFANKDRVEIFRKREEDKLLGNGKMPGSLVIDESVNSREVKKTDGNRSSLSHQDKNNGTYDDRIKISVRAKKLMMGDLSKNIVLMPGDVIVVKESLF